MSLFLCICRGEFDALQQWPFRHRLSICLVDQLAAAGLASDDPADDQMGGEQRALASGGSELSPGPRASYSGSSGAATTGNGDVVVTCADETLGPQSGAAAGDAEADGQLYTSGHSLGHSMGVSGDSWRDGDGGANAAGGGSSSDKSHHVDVTPVPNVHEAMLHLLDRPTSERNKCFGRKRFIRLEKMRALVLQLHYSYTTHISSPFERAFLVLEFTGYYVSNQSTFLAIH